MAEDKSYLDTNKQPVEDREQRKFQADANDEVAVNVVSEQLDQLIALQGGSSSASETIQFSGSVGTTEIDLPATPDGEIQQVIISCLAQSPTSKRLQFSLDGGATYFTLTPGSMVGWEPKIIEQIKIKGSVANVAYDILMNRKVP